MPCLKLCDYLDFIKLVSKIIMGSDPAHGWPHIMRVEKIAEQLIERESLRDKINVCIFRTALYLHDVGRFLPGDENHAEKSAVFAGEFLSKLEIERECIEQVVHAIRSHSYSLGIEAETLEAKLLSDADKIDALGAVGIARVFHTGCQLGRGFEYSIQHFYDKILKLVDLLYLESSKIVALDRVKIIKYFLEEWDRESKSH